MSVRYSACHFAEVMPESLIAKYIGAEREHYYRCSFCGEVCELVPMEHTLEHDLELTLRRWKDGDCTLDEMFDRVNKELFRSWNEAFKTAASTLQSKGKTKYKLNMNRLDWEEVETEVNDLASKDGKADTDLSNPPKITEVNHEP